jgi:hypothetical protein
MCDDDLHDFMGKATGRFVRDGRLWRHIAGRAVDVDLALVPSGLHSSREAYPYGANGAEVRAVYAHWLVGVPGAGGVDLPEQPTCPVAWGFVVVGVRWHRRLEVIRLDQAILNPRTGHSRRNSTRNRRHQSHSPRHPCPST